MATLTTGVGRRVYGVRDEASCQGPYEAEKAGAESSQGLDSSEGDRKWPNYASRQHSGGGAYQDVFCEMHHQPIAGEGPINMLRLDIKHLMD